MQIVGYSATEVGLRVGNRNWGRTASVEAVRSFWPVTHVHKENCPKCGVKNPVWRWDSDMLGWICAVCGVCVYPDIVVMRGVSDE
jgi:hypothetical protein